MPTTIYETGTVTLMDGTEIYMTPLKIVYLRQFMEMFQLVKMARGDQEAIPRLVDCALVAMKQYHSAIKTAEDLEDNVDLPTVYKILKVAAGIDIDSKKTDETVKDQAVSSGISWDELDLAKLESEVFLLGIWKDYEELERSLSMAELTATLEAKRESEYELKKFQAAIAGIDLDEQSEGPKEDPWEAMKARVFSNGQATSSNDVLALQGINAQKAGFGIGMGLEYEDLG